MTPGTLSPTDFSPAAFSPAGSRPTDLLGIGECMVEFHAARPLGEAAHLTRAYGGDVLNALISAARLGSRAAFLSRVGNDPFGPPLRRAWAAEGIDVTHAPLVPGENGVYFISLQPGGEREFTYRRAGSAASLLTPDDVTPQAVQGSRAVLLSGITQALSASAQAATLRAARLAREAGTLVAFDPNHRPRLWEARAGHAAHQAARDAWTELLPFVDLLLPSWPADTLFLDPQDAATPERSAAAFAALGPAVALKAGGDGAFLHARSGAAHVPAQANVTVIDTTGAGDAWNGAFLHALLRGDPPAQAAGLAHRVAAHSLQFRGAVPPRPERPITDQSSPALNSPAPTTPDPTTPSRPEMPA
ncbi:sugar kinase [Deinococcus knuensis]|uniref:2-dehydro-3-deoxygluconokinase n=1 Tax=Deinococcus knuensis TaxID=1837380 RepID=A0ABQ2SXJ0_9DEIO|nr:sugar kinase [Deinococcus knuensis]GGS39918.1 2-dehydro-3-deoxygluconokinase [Deinococcus knuensis]